jgi:hypothetical protein
MGIQRNKQYNAGKVKQHLFTQAKILKASWKLALKCCFFSSFEMLITQKWRFLNSDARSIFRYTIVLSMVLAK